MPRLRVLSAKQVCKILQTHGFTLIRQKGSHLILRRELPGRNITVPVPNHSELREAHSKSIIEQSELPKTHFMA